MNDYVELKGNVFNNMKGRLLKGFSSILKECIVKNCKGEVYIAGGALTSIATNTDINDYDLYFSDPKDRGIVLEGFIDYCVYVSCKAVSLSIEGVTYQVIATANYTSPDVIFDNFDFTVNMAAYAFKGDKLYVHNNFLYHCAQRYIDFSTSTWHPLSSLLRMFKYQDKGYYVGRRAINKALLTASRLNISSWEEFEEQLGGLYGHKFDIPEDTSYSFEKAIEVLDNEGNFSLEEFYKNIPNTDEKCLIPTIFSNEKLDAIKLNNEENSFLYVTNGDEELSMGIELKSSSSNNTCVASNDNPCLKIDKNKSLNIIREVSVPKYVYLAVEVFDVGFMKGIPQFSFNCNRTLNRLLKNKSSSLYEINGDISVPNYTKPLYILNKSVNPNLKLDNLDIEQGKYLIVKVELWDIALNLKYHRKEDVFYVEAGILNRSFYSYNKLYPVDKYGLQAVRSGIENNTVIEEAISLKEEDLFISSYKELKNLVEGSTDDKV